MVAVTPRWRELDSNPPCNYTNVRSERDAAFRANCSDRRTRYEQGRRDWSYRKDPAAAVVSAVTQAMRRAPSANWLRQARRSGHR